MKESFTAGVRSLLCLLRITAVNSVSIPTENLALLAGLSGGTQETRMENNGAGSEQTEEQDEMMGYHAAPKTRGLSRFKSTASPKALLATRVDVYRCPLLP